MVGWGGAGRDEGDLGDRTPKTAKSSAALFFISNEPFPPLLKVESGHTFFPSLKSRNGNIILLSQSPAVLLGLCHKSNPPTD